MLDIPYVEFEDIMTAAQMSFSALARQNIEAQRWESNTIVCNPSLWMTRIEWSDDADYVRWCWLSTVRNAPAWTSLQTTELKPWMDLWLHILQKGPRNWWSALKPDEDSRLESGWTRAMGEVLYCSHIQPLFDWWDIQSRQADNDITEAFFWRLCRFAFVDKPVLGTQLLPKWCSELKRTSVSESVLLQMLPVLSQGSVVMPFEAQSWIEHLIQYDSDAVKEFNFVGGHIEARWREPLLLSVMRGVVSQTLSDDPLPTSILAVWKVIPSCSYSTRIKMAMAILGSEDVDRLSKRWPVNFQFMDDCILRANPDADLAAWGSSPWVAALLHIVPEFSRVALFHDVLPLTPGGAMGLLCLYLDSELQYGHNLEAFDFSNIAFEAINP